MANLKLLIISILLSSAVSGCGALSSHDFSQVVADCKAMDDVTFIVEGRFTKPKKLLEKMARNDISKAKRKGVEPPPKLIYVFRPDTVHLGSTGATDNRTGKQMVRSMVYKIREGEAPEGLKGKGVLCYKDSKPRTIKSVHFAP